ncbi:MAG: GNAT family N-acetyltransferase [Rhodospirillales bacterium]
MIAAGAASTAALDCREQAFETGIAGLPVAKLTLPDNDDGIAPALADLQQSWREQGMWLVSCRVPADRKVIIQELENIDFSAIETLITFYQKTRPARDLVAETGLARTHEIDACVDLALGAFTYDRLHRDKRVPDRIADAIRAAWVRNDIAGRAAAPLVARIDDRVAGFNLCLKTGRTAVIDLIAVASDFRRRGLAGQMIEAAFHHFGGTIDGIRVGTQEDNTASIKLYESAGFEVETRQVTLHWVNPEVTP